MHVLISRAQRLSEERVSVEADRPIRGSGCCCAVQHTAAVLQQALGTQQGWIQPDTHHEVRHSVSRIKAGSNLFVQAGMHVPQLGVSV